MNRHREEYQLFLNGPEQRQLEAAMTSGDTATVDRYTHLVIARQIEAREEARSRRKPLRPGQRFDSQMAAYLQLALADFPALGDSEARAEWDRKHAWALRVELHRQMNTAAEARQKQRRRRARLCAVAVGLVAVAAVIWLWL